MDRPDESSDARSVRVIVLAAGKGSRLGGTGESTPKWLLDVGGRTIAERQLDAVERARREASGGEIADVTVVTGHAAEEIDRFLRERSGNGVGTLHNPHFADINNWYSVLLALREVPGGGDPRVVIVNGDLCADPDWLAAFIADAGTTDTESLIGIDLDRDLTDESMKVEVEGRDPALVRRIGKVGMEDPAGEYVGLLMVRGSVLEAFRSELERFVGIDAHRDEWYEGAVGATAAAGVDWVVWPTPDSRWVEIDDDGDLEQAIGLAAEASA